MELPARDGYFDWTPGNPLGETLGPMEEADAAETADTAGALAASQVDPRYRKHLLFVYVHGYMGSKTDLQFAKDVLVARGYASAAQGGRSPCGPAVPSLHLLCSGHTAISHGPLSQSAKAVLAEMECFLARQGVDPRHLLKIHFVAHSLGALIVRRLMDYIIPRLKLNPKQIGHFLSLNGPTIGAPPRNRLVSLASHVLKGLHPALRALRDFRDGKDLHVLSMTDNLAKFDSVTLVGTVGDGFVPWECALAMPILPQQERLAENLHHSLHTTTVKQVVVCFHPADLESGSGIDRASGKVAHTQLLLDGRVLSMLYDTVGF